MAASYAAICKLIDRGQIANPVTLKNLFDQDGALAEIGGAQYLARLAESRVTIINAEDYGRRIYDLHLRRQLITIGEDVVNEAYAHDLDDAAHRADRAGRAEAVRSRQHRPGRRRVPRRSSRRSPRRSTWPRRRSSASGRTIGVATGLHRPRQEAGRAAPVRSRRSSPAGRRWARPRSPPISRFNAAKAYRARHRARRPHRSPRTARSSASSRSKCRPSSSRPASSPRNAASRRTTSARGEVRNEDFDQLRRGEPASSPRCRSISTTRRRCRSRRCAPARGG